MGRYLNCHVCVFEFVVFCDNSSFVTLCLHAQHRDATWCQLTLGDLSAMMRKSNNLAEQVDALMQQESEKSASWQRKVVQRWVEPTLCLIKAVLSNAAATHKVLSKKLRALKAKKDSPQGETRFQGTQKQHRSMNS